MLVDGVTKLDKVSFGEAAQSETVRKMVVAMAKDIRVLMIKLADRLHNARTWRFVSAESSARKARETLEIFAPLAHRLGMNTIKWELEDLSFAALYPKVYEEIVRMVGDRTPEREKNLAVIRNQITEDLRAAKIKATITGRPKHYYSIYQKMIVRRQGLRRHQRPDGRPRAGRLGAGLLRRPRRHALALEPDPGPVQGLHRDAQVQHVPVAAHHGDRPGRQAGRDPDPHPRDAPPRRVRRRRALEVQGGQPNRDGGRAAAARATATWPGCAQLLDWQRRRPTPASSSTRCASRSTPARCSSSPRKGEVIGAARRVRRRSTSRTRCTPRWATAPSARGSTASSSRSTANSNTATGRDLHLEGRRRRPQPGLAALRQERPGAQQDPAVVQQGAPRGGDRAAARSCSTKAMRKQGLPLQRLMTHDALAAVAERLQATPTSTALYAGVGEGHVSRPVRRGAAGRGLGGDDERPRRTSPRSRIPDPRRAKRRTRDSGRRRPRRRRRLGQARQVLHAGARRRDPGLRHPRLRRLGAPGRLHQRRRPAGPARADRRGRVGADRSRAVPGRDPGRGARPEAAALRRHPGALRQPRQHPVGERAHLHATGWRSRSSPSRWATRST